MGNVCARRRPCVNISESPASSRPGSRLLSETQADALASEDRKHEIMPETRQVFPHVTADPGKSVAESSSQLEDATVRIGADLHTSPSPVDADLSDDALDENRSSPSTQMERPTRKSSAYRDVIMTGDAAAIELVMRIAKDVVLNPSDAKYRSVKKQAIHRRINDKAHLVLDALQAAGFVHLEDNLVLPTDGCLEPLREFLRLADRTRNSYWKPTPTPQPAVKIKPDEWVMMVSPDSGGYVIAEKDAELWSQTFRRTGNEARTWRGGQTPRVTVTFMNWSQAEKLTFSWIDSRSLNPTEQHWGELKAKCDVDQRTFVSHAWVIRLAGGHAIGGYVPIDPGPGAHHFVSIGQHRDMPSRADFGLLVQERTARATEESSQWRDEANARAARAASLPPRPRSEHWGVLAWPPRSGMAVAETEADSWTGTHRGVGMEGHRWQGSRTQQVQLVFVNCSSESVAISWLDIHNQWRERYDYDIEPGASKEQSTYIYHAWSFRDKAGRAVGGYVPMDTSDSVRHVVFLGPCQMLPSSEDLHRRAQSYT